MTVSLKDFDPKSLPKAYLELIGLATAAASHTEYAVETALIGFLGLVAKTDCNTNSQAIRALALLCPNLIPRA